jgi:hypothetical protein
MDKKEFEKEFKKALVNIPFVVVKLRDATFYTDDYFIGEKGVYLFWRGIVIGNCKIKSILYVF